MNNRRNKAFGIGLTVTAIGFVGGALLRRRIKSKRNEKMLEKGIYKTGAVRKFGTLFVNGEKYKCPHDLENFEDMPEYDEGIIEIRKSDRNSNYLLSWVEVVEHGKKLLVCDRNILKNISWNELDSQGLVHGKVVIIDGSRYILRLLTGMKSKGNNSEWDRYVKNEDDILGLPECTEADLKDATEDSYLEQKDSESNKLWNWYKFCSFTQDDYHISSKFAVIRGFYSTKSSHYANKDKRYDTIGYRPVLELLD